MRRLVKAFDRWLSRRLAIFVFTEDPQCILRLRLVKAPRLVRIGGQEIQPGAPLLELHLWNEHLPPIPAAGPDLAFGLRARRLMLKSFQLLAGAVAQDPRLLEAQAFYGLTALVDAGLAGGGEQLARRLGFQLLPYRPPLGRFGEFWEYVYAWALVWAYNPGGLGSLRFSRFQRSEIWMLKEELLRRFLAASPGKA
jgi:hypothetical protein